MAARMHTFNLFALGLLVLFFGGIPLALALKGAVSSGRAAPPAASITLRILSPAGNSTVDSPFTLSVASEGVSIAAPEEGVKGAAHYHAFVDIHPFTPGGQVIPEAPGIHSFASDTIELDLPPGPHRIIVALGDNEHVRLANASVDYVDIEVR